MDHRCPLLFCQYIVSLFYRSAVNFGSRSVGLSKIHGRED